MKRRSTSTTTVLALASLTTTPCSTRFGMSALLFLLGAGRGPLLGLVRLIRGGLCRFLFSLLGRGLFGAGLGRRFGGLRRRPGLRQGDRLRTAFAKHGQDTGDVVAHDPEARGILELAARPLKAQIDLLLLQLDELIGQLVHRVIAKFGNFRHGLISPHAVSRATKRVAIG